MNEHKEQTGFYLVLPSTSSDEIFLENHAGKFTVLLPKESIWMKNFVGKWL